MTDEQLARSWAHWEASRFLDDLDELDIGEVDDPAFREHLETMLTRIAISNAHRSPVMASPEGGEAG